MKILFIIAVAIHLTHSAWAIECPDQCKSELLRVEASPKVLSSDALQSLLPALRQIAEAKSLQAKIEHEFPINPLSFPPNKETCRRRKAEKDPAFLKVDCELKTLCSDPATAMDVRSRICFGLPCPLIEGTLNVGKCQGVTTVYPTAISFPQPVDIEKIRLEPTLVTVKGNEAKLCFKINELDVKVGVALTLNTAGTLLTDQTLKMNNVHSLLDGPRSACITAKISLTAKEPVSEMKITTPEGQPFISDKMILAAAPNLELSGFSGYPKKDLDQVKAEVVPVLFQPLRESVESAIKEGLSGVFTEELNKLSSINAQRSIPVDSKAFTSELGVANLLVKNKIAVLECAALSAAKRPIPTDHACIGQNHFGSTITPSFSGPTYNELMDLPALFEDKNVSSESIKQRLIALKEVLLAEESCCHSNKESPEEQKQSELRQKELNLKNYNKFVAPLINQISANQLELKLPELFEIHNQISNSSGRNVALSLPEICSDKPSPHANRSMKDCPVQVYADLNEFNQIMTKLWESGGICMKGHGKFKPKLQSGTAQFTSEGAPLSQGGCYLEAAGMGCFIKTAPQIKYDPSTKKYKTAVALEQCFRGPVALGQGRFGGDFNIDLSYKPAACENGDFCVKNAEAKWAVVPGSERFALRPSSPLQNVVTDKISDAITSALGNTIRIPLSTVTGPMAAFPLEAEGRVDAGPGYFGVCMQPKKDNFHVATPE